jgi:hypothetical protein
MTNDILNYYRQRLMHSPAAKGDAGAEAISQTEGRLSNDNIKDKINQTTEELHRIVTEYLDDRPEFHDLADQIKTDGKDALNALSNGDQEYLIRNNLAETLEVIVRTDGSRPSFLVRNGKVDLQSSPAGTWSNVIEANSDKLNKAIACVGRINLAGLHIGTGFLVADNYILTNRHVMQAICTQSSNGNWQLKADATIDFGFEYRAIASLNPRKIIALTYTIAQDIDERLIDHNKLDLSLLELETVATEFLPREFLSIDISSEWSQPESGSMIYTMGYPANPGISGLAAYGTLLDTLFHSTYGYKRLAPGMVMTSTIENSPISTAHDATTLGGNSGSPVVRVGRELAVSGLHYGGANRIPRENWCHVLGKCLPIPGIPTTETLKEVLEAKGIKLTDDY